MTTQNEVVSLVTGASAGIGLATAEQLAKLGHRVFAACRSEAKARPVIEAIKARTGNPNIELLPLDLGDLDSVRECARSFLARGLPLHLLINNAGTGGGSRGLTKSGFELMFGTNHVGHFLLTQLLQQRLQESAPARVVTVASRAHDQVKAIDWDALRRPTRSAMGVPEYALSKLANVLHSAELARRLAGTGVTTYSVHPGVVASEAWRNVPLPLRAIMKLFMLSPEKGARTSLHCATSGAAAAETGLFYDKGRPTTPSTLAQDHALAAELWTRSEQYTA